MHIISFKAHHNHDTDSPHSGYISGVCHNTAVEVFDSVTLLALLVVADKDSHFSKIWSFNKLIIVLSSLNLMLPTVALYMLSMSGRTGLERDMIVINQRSSTVILISIFP